MTAPQGDANPAAPPSLADLATEAPTIDVAVAKEIRRQSDPLPSPGDRIDGSIVLERSLGDGGMGAVLLGRALLLERRVAVKFMHREMASDADARERFLREARVLSRVVHPNVVAIHGVGDRRGSPYLVMEYVAGQNLAAFMRQKGPCPPAEALALVKQVALGLSEAHALGIVHRDVKPANILLKQGSGGHLQVKVCDFGLARSYEDLRDEVTRADAVMGSPAYMSPEQVRGEKLDERSDQYALAVVLYELLTGKTPFQRESSVGILMAHLGDEPPPLAACGRSFPQPLEAAVAKALAKERTERFADVLTFVVALQTALGLDEPATAGTQADCAGCGLPFFGGGAFCGRCGAARLLAECATCGDVAPHPNTTCGACGASLVALRRGESALASGGEWAPATVLAGQFRGEASHTADAIESLCVAMQREGGHVWAVLGRQALVAFGLGNGDQRAVESAVDAALLLAAQGQWSLGVAQGAVRTRGAGMAWGTALVSGPVVDAARAGCERGQAGEIWLSEAARRAVAGLYECREQQGELVRVVRRADQASGLTRLLRGAEDSPLLGRDSEVAQLMGACRKVVRQARLTVIPLVGPAGVGKSRLLGSVARQLAQGETPWAVEVGRCSPQGLAPAYEPFAQMLAGRLQADGMTTPEAMRARMELVGIKGSQEDTQVHATALFRLLGLGLGGGDHPPLPATTQERSLAFSACAAYLQALAHERPLLMVVEDAHWARTPTLELLAHLAETCADHPIALVLCLRPERAEAVLDKLGVPPGRTVVVDVAPLDDADARDLLEGLPGGRDLDEASKAEMLAFAGGLPLFLEQVLQASQDSGADGMLTKTAGLDGLVLARLARLAPNARHILQALALTGSSAPRGLVAAMTRQDLAARDVEPLKQSQFIAESRSSTFVGERDLLFRLESVRDSIASAVPAAQRREMHGLAFAWLQAWTGPKPSGYAALCAQHAVAAGQPEVAVEALLALAAEATRAFDNREALHAYSSAAQWAEKWRAEDPEDWAAKSAWVGAQVGIAELAAALADYEVVEHSAAALGGLCAQNPGQFLAAHARALTMQGDTLVARARFEQAGVVYAQAMQAGEGLGIGVYAAARRAMTRFRQGHHGEASEAAKAALLRAEALGPSYDRERALGSLHGTLGHIAVVQRRFAEAADHYAHAKRHMQTANDPMGAALATLAQGHADLQSGDYESASRHTSQALEVCRRFGHIPGEVAALTNLGHVCLDQANYDKALEYLDRAEQLGRRTQSQHLPEMLRLQALARLGRNDTDGAAAAASEALHLADALQSADVKRSATEALQVIARAAQRQEKR
ncbi:MAG: protein kinase [Deltaproteobacteria bacterium]|nr:protein kinase [Deltaproteobacteria bacterium]